MLYNNLRREWRICLGKIIERASTNKKGRHIYLEQKHKICVKFTSVLQSKLFRTQHTSLDNKLEKNND